MSRIDDKHLCAALDAAAALRPAFDEIARRFDAVLTPSAPGEAPVGLASTGDSIFNGLWTRLHAPREGGVATSVEIGLRRFPAV